MVIATEGGTAAPDSASTWTAPAAVAPARSLSLGEGRIGGFDLLKVFAAYGIVLFHLNVRDFKLAGAMGLVLFYMIMFVLLALPSRRRSFTETVRTGVQRLILPWLVWSAVYLAALLYMARGDLAGLRLPPNWLVVGTAPHLWFLFFAFLASLAMWGIRQATRGMSDRRLLVVTSGAAAALLAFLPKLLRVIDWSKPFELWWFGLSAVFLGVAVNVAVRLRDREGARWALPAVGMAATAGCLGAWAWGPPLGPLIAIPYGLATWLLIGCLAWPLPSVPWLQGAASATVGVYLLHPLVDWSFLAFVGGESTPVLRSQAVYVISFVATLCMLRVPGARVLLGR